MAADAEMDNRAGRSAWTRRERLAMFGCWAWMMAWFLTALVFDDALWALGAMGVASVAFVPGFAIVHGGLRPRPAGGNAPDAVR